MNVLSYYIDERTINHIDEHTIISYYIYTYHIDEHTIISYHIYTYHTDEHTIILYR